MKILFFTEISPYPVNGGEQIRTYGLLKVFSELGYQVTAIIRNEANIEIEKYLIPNITYEVLQQSNITLWDKLTLNKYFKKDKNITHQIKNIITNFNPNIAFLDYAFIGQYISIFKKFNIPVIYGTHNAQSKLTQQLPARGVYHRIRKLQMVICEKIHERKFFPKSDCLIVVSMEDKIFHSRFVASENIIIIPNFLNENLYKRSFSKEEYFIMPANFNAFQNTEGLKWLITKVWDSNLDLKHRLLVVGKNSINSLNEIKESHQFKNIVAIGMVDDMIPYIGKSKAVLIPILYGSGSRLKCLEAMALNTSIISTSKGIEGVSSSNIKIADSPEEFKRAIQESITNEAESELIYQDFYQNHSLFAIKIVIKSLIDNIL